jgi:hypothetical protein
MRSQGEYLVFMQEVTEVLSIVLVSLQCYQMHQDIRRDKEVQDCRRIMQKMKESVDSRQF